MEKNPPAERYVLRIYNANRTSDSEQLGQKFEQILNEHYPGCCRVEVIDVLTEPERAVDDRVYVTPTLVKALPEPIRRVIGDVSDPNKVLMLLGVLSEERKD